MARLARSPSFRWGIDEQLRNLPSKAEVPRIEAFAHDNTQVGANFPREFDRVRHRLPNPWRRLFNGFSKCQERRSPGWLLPFPASNVFKLSASKNQIRLFDEAMARRPIEEGLKKARLCRTECQTCAKAMHAKRG
jgi:hypothetical protein